MLTRREALNLCGLGVLALCVGCGGGGYPTAKVAPIRSEKALQVVTDTSTTEFSGDAFPEDVVNRARVAYRLVTPELVGEAFAEHGLQMSVTGAEQPPQSGLYLQVKIVTLDGSSTEGAVAGAFRGSAIGGLVGDSGVATASIEVVLTRADTSEVLVQDSFLFEGEANLVSQIDSAKDPADKKLLENAATACLYAALDEFAEKLASSLE